MRASSTTPLGCAGMFCAILLLLPSTGAADLTKLRINEILASNNATPPADLKGKFNDLLEIYNPSKDSLTLDGLILANATVADGGTGAPRPADPPASFTIAAGTVQAKGFILIQCDGKGGVDADGIVHATFKLSAGGDTAALFTPAGDLIDLVVFPALATDTAYGRFPDGADTLCTLVAPTFRKGPVTTGGVLDAQNAACGNMPPTVNLLSLASLGTAADADPAPGTEVPILADTQDDKEGGIASCAVLYSVDGGAETESPLTMDSIDPADARLVHWKGAIPGQPAGATVVFRLRARDSEGAEGTDPLVLCQSGQTSGCKPAFRYRVGFVYAGPLLLNEACPDNLTLLIDPATAKAEDYIEIYNPSATETVSLDSLWLTTSPFHPQEWQFPGGSAIHPGQHLLVWCDKKDSQTDAGASDFHTSFSLSKSGDGVFLFTSEAEGLGLIDGCKFGLSGDDLSWSRSPEGSRSSPFLALAGTPGAPNGLPPAPTFIRGDTDGDGILDLKDANAILVHLFLGGTPPPCLEAADADDSSVIDVTDPIVILAFLFLQGPQPRAPFPAAGNDPTPDALGCTD